MKRWKMLTGLLRDFMKFGLFTFGGGWSIVAQMQKRYVEQQGLLTQEELLDLTAVAQCTPGVIAVNTATFCGYRTRGIPGALWATLGILVPPMVIVTLIAAFFWSFTENPWVGYALTGVRACVCALIVNSTIRLYRKAIVDLPTFLIFLVVLLLAAFVGLSPALLVIAAGVFGLVYHQIQKVRKERTP